MIAIENKLPVSSLTIDSNLSDPAPLNRAILMDCIVGLLIQKAKLRLYWADLYEHCHRVLFTLRLSATVRDLASRRLSNAEAYANGGEYGAAAYELRLLRTQLA